MTYDAIDIAKWLLYEAKKQGISMTHMKLQKLLYYAQAYFIGITGKPLFHNVIQAWQHGPVVPDVYNIYKKFGNSIINNIEYYPAPYELSHLISFIIRDKGQFSAHDLRNMTHNEDTWKTAWNSPSSKNITDDMIRNSFTQDFWASDEEDEYQPSFDSQEEEKNFFLQNINGEEINAIINSR